MPLNKLESHPLRSLPRQLRGLDGSWSAGIVEGHYPAKLRHNLFEDLQPLGGEISARMIDTRESSPRLGEAIHEPENNGVGPGTEHDGDLRGRPPCCYSAVGGSRVNQIDFLLFETFGCLLGSFCITRPISDCENILFSFFKSQLL